MAKIVSDVHHLNSKIVLRDTTVAMTMLGTEKLIVLISHTEILHFEHNAMSRFTMILGQVLLLTLKYIFKANELYVKRLK